MFFSRKKIPLKSSQILLLCCFIITAVGIVAIGMFEKQSPAITKAVPVLGSPKAEEISAPTQFTPNMNAEQVRLMVAGNWKSSYYGTRHLTIREDGTARIYYQPNMVARFVIGKQLLLNYSWEYDQENTQVIFTAIEGFPQKSYDYVLKKWGKNQRQKVVDASEQMLLLLDMDGETKHHWKRVQEIPAEILEQFKNP